MGVGVGCVSPSACRENDSIKNQPGSEVRGPYTTPYCPVCNVTKTPPRPVLEKLLIKSCYWCVTHQLSNLSSNKSWNNPCYSPVSISKFKMLLIALPLHMEGVEPLTLPFPTHFPHVWLMQALLHMFPVE